MSCALAWLILALYHTALGEKGENRLVRVKEGESFTISCSTDRKLQDSLTLFACLDKTVTQLLHLDLKNKALNTKPQLKGRLQYPDNGDPYKFLITISNLTVQDTQIYWCVYSRFDPENGSVVETKGEESVLLVVDEQCNAGEASSLRTYLLFGLASVVCVLLLIGYFYICSKKKGRRAQKRAGLSRPNDVYEDMRATIRR